MAEYEKIAKQIVSRLSIEDEQQSLLLIKKVISMLRNGRSPEYVVGFLSLSAARIEWLLQKQITLDSKLLKIG